MRSLPLNAVGVLLHRPFIQPDERTCNMSMDFKAGAVRRCRQPAQTARPSRIPLGLDAAVRHEPPQRKSQGLTDSHVVPQRCYLCAILRSEHIVFTYRSLLLFGYFGDTDPIILP